MRKECEQHYTPARDNQYRSTARYYADNCPYCEIDRLKEALEYTKEMSNAFMDERNELRSQLAEANERCRLLDEKAGDWQYRYTQETMRLQSQLAERDKLIENQQAEIESRNQLRYDALKGEHSRSPYYYDSWCKLHDHKGVVGTSDKPPIYYAVNLLNKLTEQNDTLREEVKRLNQLKSIGDLTNMLAEARKQTAQEFLDLAEEYEGGKCELYDLVAKKYGLEG